MTISIRSLSDGLIPQLLDEWLNHPQSSGVLCDLAIQQHIPIKPMHTGPTPAGAISYGLSSYGYDVRVGYKFKIFSNVNCAVVDPKEMDARAFVDIDLTPEKHTWGFLPNSDTQVCSKCDSRYSGPAHLLKDLEQLPCIQKPNHILIPPNSFALAETIEYLEIPRDILVIGIGKSTYARVGIILNVTPLEPEWRGKITLEISNSTPLPVKVYAAEGICQLIFFKCPLECMTSYADKKGIYQDQKGLTLPSVKKA